MPEFITKDDGKDGFVEILVKEDGSSFFKDRQNEIKKRVKRDLRDPRMSNPKIFNQKPTYF